MDSMFTELENTPLAERARKAILDAILTGRFENDRLPSEDDLSKMLNVSRTTIRTALHSLEQDGIVTRRRAIGTTINRHVGSLDPRPAAPGRLRLAAGGEGPQGQRRPVLGTRHAARGHGRGPR